MANPKLGQLTGNRGKGRPKGVPNKTTAVLKDAILKAAEAAGGEEGIEGYLTTQAKEQPVAFLSLLGKVLPLQLTGENGGPVEVRTLADFYGGIVSTGTPDTESGSS